MKNERGFMVFGLILIVAAIVGMYFASVVSSVNRSAQTRSLMRQAIYAEEVMNSAGTILRAAYLKAQSGACAGTPTATYGVSICLPPTPPNGATAAQMINDYGCIENRFSPGNPICLQQVNTANGYISFQPIQRDGEFIASVKEFWQNLAQLRFEIGMPTASAQLSPIERPPLPGANPMIAAGAIAAPAGAELVSCATFRCVKVSVCLLPSGCPTGGLPSPQRFNQIIALVP